MIVKRLTTAGVLIATTGTAAHFGEQEWCQPACEYIVEQPHVPHTPHAPVMPHRVQWIASGQMIARQISVDEHDVERGNAVIRPQLFDLEDR